MLIYDVFYYNILYDFFVLIIFWTLLIFAKPFIDNQMCFQCQKLWIFCPQLFYILFNFIK